MRCAWWLLAVLLVIGACEVVEEPDLLVGDWAFDGGEQLEMTLVLHENGDAVLRVESTIHDTTTVGVASGTWRRAKDRLLMSMTHVQGRRFNPPVSWDSTILSSTENLLCLAVESLFPTTAHEPAEVCFEALR